MVEAIGGIERSFRFRAAFRPVTGEPHRLAGRRQNTLTVLYGGPGKGRSFFAIDLACCVATGTPFHG